MFAKNRDLGVRANHIPMQLLKKFCDFFGKIAIFETTKDFTIRLGYQSDSKKDLTRYSHKV